MLPDPYDRTSRYLLRRNEGPLSAYLLAVQRQRVTFRQWLDTRSIPWPRSPERVCDTVAWLDDLERGGVPWALVFEFQIDPDPEMFGRLLIYLGSLWLDKQPGDGRGDRFCVAAVVINLRGRGQSGRQMEWAEAGLRVVLQPREWNLADLDAESVLAGVEAGEVPLPFLAWLPCMAGGDREELIARWRDLAGREADPGRRADLGLAVVFAEAAGCSEVWERGLEGWNVVQSKIVKQWQDEGEARGVLLGEVKGKVGTLLRVMVRKYGQVPDEVATVIRATDDVARLDAWIETAALTADLEQFRADAGL